jgi:hypothetical protein
MSKDGAAKKEGAGKTENLEAAIKASIGITSDEWDDNGPKEVGIASGLDSAVFGEDKICILADSAYRGESDVTKRNLNAVHNLAPVGTTVKIARAYSALAAWLATHNTLVTSDLYCEVASPMAVTDTRVALIKNLSKDDIDLGISIAMATKVNWWTMNHHTGQGQAAGYFQKFASLKLIDTPGAVLHATDVKACWRMGHWIDTKIAINHLRGDEINDSLPVPTEDLLLRVESKPSGTALIFDTQAALKLAMLSACAYAIPIAYAPSIKYVWTKCKDINNDPLAYHVGAGYLGVTRKRIDVGMFDKIVPIAKACIEVLAKESTLANSKVLNRYSVDIEARMAMASIIRASSDTTQNRVAGLISMMSAGESGNAFEVAHIEDIERDEESESDADDNDNQRPSTVATESSVAPSATAKLTKAIKAPLPK